MKTPRKTRAGRGRRSVQRIVSPPVNGLDGVAGELDALALLMRSTAAKMKYFGGFDGVMKQHADELAGAANIARGWAKGIRARRANDRTEPREPDRDSGNQTGVKGLK